LERHQYSEPLVSKTVREPLINVYFCRAAQAGPHKNVLLILASRVDALLDQTGGMVKN